MRRIYLTMFALAIAGGSAFSQSKSDTENHATRLKDRVAPRIDVQEIRAESDRAGGGAIWSDDFSTPSNWAVGHDSTASSLEWEIGMDLGAGGGAPIDTIQSTTKANGYAMVDSDEYGGANGGSEVEDSWIQTASPIDLSGHAHVVLEFETWYRRWNYEKPYVVISTDGTWPDLTPDTDISGMPNVYDVFGDFPDATSLAQNPTLKRINISASAGNQSQVWIRFHWTGTWGYCWFVDDARILDQPANDLVTNSAYIAHVPTGEEYGRIPQSQLGSDFYVGGEFYNFGFTDQNNVVATVDVLDGSSNSAFSSVANYSVAYSDSTYNMDEVATPSGQLAVGSYTGSLAVVSDEEGTSAGTFWNNTYLRNFDVTSDRYSLDGIGVHPSSYQNVGSLGTNSFTGAEDGFMMLVYYDVAQLVSIRGVEILLSSATVPGGTLIVSLLDTADVLTAGDVTLPVEQSDVIEVTQADVDAGSMTVMFAEPFEADANGYYVSVEMFSNTNANDIRILNDLTVVQPSLASLIYIPNDQIYTNGNAAAIRLITDDNVGIADQGQLEGVSIYPNPTEGIVRIDLQDKDSYTIEVMNVLGEMIYTSSVSSATSIDLNQFGAGIYVVRVSTDAAAYTERVIVE